MNAMMTFPAPMAREFPPWRMQAGWASACPWWSSTPSSPGFGLSSSRRYIRGDNKVLTARIRMERWTSFKKKWHSSIPKHEGKESNQRETSRTWEDKQPWDSGIIWRRKYNLQRPWISLSKLLKSKLLTRCWCSSSSWSFSGSSRSQSSSQAGETSSKGACCNFYIYHGNCN